MKAWLKQTLPPWPYTAGFLIVLAVAEGFRVGGVYLDGLDAEFVSDRYGRGWYGHQIIVGIAASVYAIWRAIHFSPIANVPYRTWLRTMPWNRDVKLPLGPWHLAGQDVLVLAFLCVLAAYGGWRLVWVPALCLLVPYAYVVSRLQWRLGLRVHACVTAIMLVALVRIWESDVLFYGMLVALWANLTWSVQRLIRLLDEDPEHVDATIPVLPTTPEQEQIATLEWPYVTLLYRLPHPKNRPSHCIALALLVAFTWYVMRWFTDRISPETMDGEFLVSALDLGYELVVPLLAVMRWSAYRASAAPPLSLLGRIRHGWLILPRFDVIWAAPIAIIAIGYGGRWIGTSLALAPTVCEPILLAACILVATLAGPSMTAWRLTGGQRLTQHPLLGQLPSMRF